jgi:hypothetical protein
LLLHPQDRAYTVPQLYEWLDDSGVKLQSFFGTQCGEDIYDPASYTQSEILRARMDALSVREKHRIAELMHGHMIKHCFYATKEVKKSAMLADDMVITFGCQHRHDPAFCERVGALLEKNALGEVYEESYNIAGAPPLRITNHALTHHILRRIDGRSSVRGIYNNLVKAGVIAQDNEVSYKQYWHDVSMLFEELHKRQKAYLQHESIAPYVSVPEIMARYHASAR